jgi:hypothetical protein
MRFEASQSWILPPFSILQRIEKESEKRRERLEATVRGSPESEPSITDDSKPYLLVTGARRHCAVKYCERSRKGRNVK